MSNCSADADEVAVQQHVLQVALRGQRSGVDADASAGAEHAAGGPVSGRAALADGAQGDRGLEETTRSFVVVGGGDQQAEGDGDTCVGGTVVVPLPVDVGDDEGEVLGDGPITPAGVALGGAVRQDVSPLSRPAKNAARSPSCFWVGSSSTRQRMRDRRQGGRDIIHTMAQSRYPSMAGRRRFLGAAGGAAALSLLPGVARAELVCRDFMDGRRCASGILSEMMPITAWQNQTQWCWAACIAMLFAYNGHPVSQPRIVLESFGGIVNLPAEPDRIVAALNRPWVDDNGQPFSVTSAPGISNPVWMAQDLADDYPLIIGTRGHAMVLTALEYAAPWVMTPLGPTTGPATILSAMVRDPWPGQGRRLLRPEEWQGIFFACHLRVR